MVAPPPNRTRTLRGLADQARRLGAAVSIANAPRDGRLTKVADLLGEVAAIVDEIAKSARGTVTHVRDDDAGAIARFGKGTGL